MGLIQADKVWEEIHDGKTITVGFHSVDQNRAAFHIACLFEDYLYKRADCVIPFGTDLHLSDHDRFMPDTMIVRDPDKLKTWGVYGAPDLVVEVIEPGSTFYDRGYKMNAYSKYGVREYWIVDIKNKAVEQYLPRDGRLELHDIHEILDEADINRLSEEERAEYSTAFRCSLYDDLIIHLEDIFESMFS